MTSKDLSEIAELEAAVLLGGDKDEIAKADEAAREILDAPDNDRLYSLIEFLTYILSAGNDVPPRHIAIHLNERPEVAKVGLKLTENYVRNILEWIWTEGSNNESAELRQKWTTIYDAAAVDYRLGISKRFTRQPEIIDDEDAEELRRETAKVQDLLPLRVPKGPPKMFELKT